MLPWFYKNKRLYHTMYLFQNVESYLSTTITKGGPDCMT
jgi:hypothetical protein